MQDVKVIFENFAVSATGNGEMADRGPDENLCVGYSPNQTCGDVLIWPAARCLRAKIRADQNMFYTQAVCSATFRGLCHAGAEPLPESAVLPMSRPASWGYQARFPFERTQRGCLKNVPFARSVDPSCFNNEKVHLIKFF